MIYIPSPLSRKKTECPFQMLEPQIVISDFKVHGFDFQFI